MTSRRLFLALELPAEVRFVLAGLQNGLPGARWVPADNLHLTLRFLGAVDEGVLSVLQGAMRQIQAAPLCLRVRDLGFFPARGPGRVLWAGIEPTQELMALQGSLEAAVQKGGLAPEVKSFHPHITLARLEQTRRSLLEDWRASHSLPPREVMIREWVLMESRPGGGPPRYTVLEQYPLAGNDLADAGPPS